MWADASGSFDRFDLSVTIRALSATGEWIYANREMAEDREYRGSIEREPGSPLSQIPVGLQFDTDGLPMGLKHGDSQTLGLVYTGAMGDVRNGFPILSVRIWDAAPGAGAAAFEAAFLRALAAGDAGVQVWLSADRKAPPVEEDGVSGYAVIQPVSRIRWQQLIRLGNRA